MKPASASKSASASGSISVPARIAIDASRSRFAGLTRGRSAAAEAMTSRAVPVAAACSASSRRRAKMGTHPRTDRPGATAAARPPTRLQLRTRLPARHTGTRVGSELVDVLVTGRDEQRKARRRPRGGHRSERLGRRRQPSRNWRKPVQIGASGRLAKQCSERKGGCRRHRGACRKAHTGANTGMSAQRFPLSHTTRGVAC